MVISSRAAAVRISASAVPHRERFGYLRAVTRTAISVLVLGLVVSCGGGGGGGANGKPVAGGDEAHDRDNPAKTDEDSADESETASDPCADQSCFRCGDGICPKGFYCDEKAGACSWLPECASEASCSCVKQGAGDSCTCEEKSGGVYARCE